jgi:hypothetical protein
MIRLEQARKRSTHPRRLASVDNDNILVQVKQDYFNGPLDFNGYQKRLRSLCYRYIHILDTSDKDDLDNEPQTDQMFLNILYYTVRKGTLPNSSKMIPDVGRIEKPDFQIYETFFLSFIEQEKVS